MAKRYVKKKKKKGLRLGRLLGLVLLLAALVLLLVWILRPSAEGEATQNDAAGAGWYADDLGRVEDGKALISGMKTFEKRTGVKPFLTLLSDIDPEELDIYAEDQYDALFTDGDHVLVVYDEWGEGAYCLTAQTGTESALLASDVSTLLTCIERAYADPANKTYADAFGAGFSEAAKELTAGSGLSGGVKLLLALGGILLLLAAALVILLRKRARDAARWDAAQWEDGDA